MTKLSDDSYEKFKERANHAESLLEKLETEIKKLKENNRSEPISKTLQGDPTFPPWYPPYQIGEEPKGSNAIMVCSLFICNITRNFQRNFPRNCNKFQKKKVKWYTCGPTVYAPSHMGHARTYITFDIIRNILEFYFGFRVNLVMNITDVDDKIILKARENYLFAEYSSEVQKWTREKVVSDIVTAFELITKKRKDALTVCWTTKHLYICVYIYLLISVQKIKKASEEELKSAQEKHKKEIEENVLGNRVKLENVLKNRQGFENAKDTEDTKTLVSISQPVLAEWLDSIKGDTVTDQKIFRAHAEEYEKQFFEDMRQLHVRDPDVLTRVTEYIPQIIRFVQQLIDNGYGYVSNHSVYFDIDKFRDDVDFPKLDPKYVYMFCF
ncbi:cysteine-tRNA ligase, partial [Reticulomyxa filosa]